MRIHDASRCAAAVVVALGVALTAAPSAADPERVVFRTHTHFKLLEPGDWRLKIRNGTVEHRCQSETDCLFVIDFGGQFTYACEPESALLQFQGQLLVPESCAIED